MATFKIASDGSSITENKYACKNNMCQKIDNFRRILTSLTPNVSVKFNVNSPKNSVQALIQYRELDS